jgi:uncharacterized protein
MLPLPLNSRRFVVLAIGLALTVGMWPGVMTRPARAATTAVFINEIHYDNVGADTQEFVEVAGPSGTNLDNYDLVFYNGDGGAPYGSIAMTGVLDDQQGGMGTATFTMSGIQNGSPDGIALIQNGNIVVQFLSYEGSFTAVGGLANGAVSTDIGVSESDADTPIGHSLQLKGTGTFYEDFTWTAPSAFSPGAPNDGQTFGTVENEPVTATCGTPLTLLQGTPGSRLVTGTDPDGTVVSLAITSTPVAGITIGATTPAASEGGTASATVSVAGTTAPGSYPVEITATNDDTEPQTGTCTLTVTVTAQNQPVTATCGPTLTLLQGTAGSRLVTGTDPDGTVVSLAITSTPVAGITIGATTPAASDGGTASATISVADTTAPGSHPIEVTATNDDAEAQTGTCTFTVTVTPVRTIGEVQGAVDDAANGLTHRSPFAPASGNGAGQQVFVRGVVTQLGRFPTATGRNWGFWLQSRVGDEDGDANSSDGIFVFIGGFQTVLRLDGGPAYQPVVGDEIVLRGNVTEFFFLTELGSPRLVSVNESGVDVTDADEIETTEADPSDSLVAANRYWERHEGMRFHLDSGAHVVAARDGFPSTKDAELWVIRGDHPINDRADPYQRIVYRDPHPLDDLPPLFDNGNGERIMLQSHGLKGAANRDDPLVAPANTYDTVTNEVAGSLYFAFNKYGIEISEQLELEAGVDPAQNFPPAAVDPAAEFATSDYNVENLYDFRDDPFDGCDFAGNLGCPGTPPVNPPFDFVPASLQAYQKHLTDLAAQIAGPMHGPDLLMIQEAEDQDICTVTSGAMDCGATNNRDGKPDTLQELALAITAAGGPTYVAVYDRDGADDRGIVSAFMYRTDTVELLPADADDPVLGNAPTIEYRGDPLAYNAQVSNPKALNADLPSDVDLSTGVDGGNVFTRPPQVGHFRVWRDGIGLSVFTDLYALSNHFSSTPNARVGQRTEQAAYNAAIAAALEEADADRVVIAGDLNVFPRPDDPFLPGQQWGDEPDEVAPSDQLGPMYDAGLNNLWDTLVAEVPRSAYSYSFEGQAQTLDMQWASDGQFADLVQIRAAHLNADFAADFDGDVARGASDHDPQVARWSTDATFARLHALVDYYVATGDLPADRAFLFHDRLVKAAAYVRQGKIGTAQSQLQAFGKQAHDYAPTAVADAMAKEATRLAGLL